ncbi:MAG: VCBS repeat-containing protein [Verrucomicrobiae bacterium]|nr:VCBS repeat-containing protein [Verrucomicrobiae bacterium]
MENAAGTVSSPIRSFTTPNLPPIANEDDFGVEEQPVTCDVLANDSDADGETPFVVSVSKARYGAVTVLGGSIVYTPDFPYPPNDRFTYQISDGFGGKATGVVYTHAPYDPDINDPYYQWCVANWGIEVAHNPLKRKKIWGEDADPDRDGIRNLLEYAFKTDPTDRKSRSRLPKPVVAKPSKVAPGTLMYRFEQRVDDPALAVIPQVSTDGRHWFPQLPVRSQEWTGDGTFFVRDFSESPIMEGYQSVGYLHTFQSKKAFGRLTVMRSEFIESDGGAFNQVDFADSVSPGNGQAVESAPVGIDGFFGEVEVSVSGGASLIVDGEEVGASAMVGAGSSLRIRSAPGVAGTYDVSLGNVTRQWRVSSNPPEEPVPVAGALSGYTQVQAGVSPSGAAQISIPVFAPPGVAGMTPNLTIGYSSQSGNGPMGIGFNLGGFSTISRVPATAAQDGFRGAIRFDSNDRFALDGQRLIAINGVDGADGTEYRLEFDSSTRIRSLGTAGIGPSQWIVENKAGLKLEFGAINNSKIRPEGGATPLVWAVTRISDTLGNRINFFYDEVARSRGELLLTQVRYTANNNAPLSHGQEIVFEYEDRPDARTTYLQGYAIQSLKRLIAIESRATVGGTMTMARRYEFEYKTSALSGSSLLTLVREVAPGGIVQSTPIEWKDGPLPSFTATRAPYPPHSSQWHYQYTEVGDFNGDGKSDLFSVGDDGKMTVMLRKSEPDFEIVRSTPADGVRRDLMWLGDFNADGLTDILTRPSGSTRIVTYRSNGDGSFTSTAFDQPLAWDTGRMTLGDFNGDGRTDFVTGIGTGTWRTFLSNGDGTFSAVSEAKSWSWNNLTILTGDFNGDGLTDFLSHNGPESGQFYWTIQKSDGDGTFTEQKAYYPESYGNGHANGALPVAGDFNGDGITDVMGVNGQFLTVFLLDGNGGVHPVVNDVGISGFGWRGDAVGSFNSDGMTDMMSWLGGGVKIVRFIAQGNGVMSAQIEDNTVPWDPNNTVWVGDFDGDGKADIISSYFEYTHFTSSTSAEDLVAKVSNNHGGYTCFDYRPLTDNTVFTKGDAKPYPCVSIQPSLYVVSATTSRNGVDGDPHVPQAGNPTYGENRMTYRYQGAWSCLNGRGFQGFEKTESVDVASGIVSYSEFEDRELFTGRVKHAEQHLDDARLIASSDTVFNLTETTHPTGLKTYLIFEESRTDREFEINGQPSSSPMPPTPDPPGGTSSPGPPGSFSSFTLERSNANPAPVKTTGSSGYQFDAFGNVLHLLVDHGGGFLEETTSTFQNIVDANRWWPGRLDRAVVVQTAQGSTVSRTSTFAYSSTTGLLTRELIETPESRLRLEKTYEHDVVGNITRSLLKDVGSGEIRTTVTRYSADHRFVEETENDYGHVEICQYDPLTGQKLAQTGPNGVTTSYQYDGIGRVTREARSDGTVTITQYLRCVPGQDGAPARAVHAVRSQNSGGGVTMTYFDVLDREIQTDVTHFSGAIVSAHKIFNPRGEVIRASEPYFSYLAPTSALRTVLEYDAVGRPVSSLAPGNRLTTTDFNGLRTTVVNPLTQSFESLRDLRGRTASATSFGDANVSYTYDPYGNLLNVDDGKGHVTSIKYDARGNKTEIVEPNSGRTIFTHNAFGEITDQTDARNVAIRMTYDLLGRMTRREEPEGTTVWEYDNGPHAKGKPVRAAIPGSGYEELYRYDSLGRPVETVYRIGNLQFVTGTTYDAYSRVSVITYPTGFAIRNEYNARGFLAAVRDAHTGAIFWSAGSYNHRGQLTRETFGNGLVSDRTYDPDTGWLTGIATGAAGTPLVQELAFGYNALGNLTSRIDPLHNIYETFGYDDRNQLTSVETTGADGSEVAQEVAIAYDPLGNIQSRSDVGAYTYGGNGAGPHAVTRVKGKINRTLAYDAAGNCVRDGDTALTYSANRQPLRITKGGTSLSFTYGPGRARYRQIEKTKTGYRVKLYIGGLFEWESSSEGTVTQTHFVPGGSGTVAIHTITEGAAGTINQTRYVHRDHLGSLHTLTGVDGTVAEVLNFDAWGRRRTLEYVETTHRATLTYQAVVSETDRGFTGHEMLDLLELVHMNGRIYDPLLGRFLSADPVVQEAGNLLNLNRYSYVLNNPLSLTDPSGFFFKSIAKLFQKIAKPLQIAATILSIFPATRPIGVALNLAVSFGSAFSGTLLNGGSVGDALRAGLKAYVITSLTMAATEGVGEAYKIGRIGFSTRVIAHGVINGAARAAQGGQFRHGFYAGAFTAAFSPVSERIDRAYGVLAGTAASALVGGTAEAVGGGKFSNGAASGAMLHIFNDIYHREFIPEKMKTIDLQLDAIKKTDHFFSDYEAGDFSDKLLTESLERGGSFTGGVYVYDAKLIVEDGVQIWRVEFEMPGFEIWNDGEYRKNKLLYDSTFVSAFVAGKSLYGMRNFVGIVTGGLDLFSAQKLQNQVRRAHPVGDGYWAVPK